MVVIRLARHGSIHKPFYHVTVADRRARRDGTFIERVGFYNPIAKGKAERLRIDLARVDYWLGQGAQTSQTVSRLVKEARRADQIGPTEVPEEAEETVGAAADEASAPVEASANDAPAEADAEEAPAEAKAEEAASADEEASAEAKAEEAASAEEEAPADAKADDASVTESVNEEASVEAASDEDPTAGAVAEETAESEADADSDETDADEEKPAT